MLVLVLAVSTVEEKVHLDVGILTFIVATAIPILTALITKANTSSAIKAVTTLTLAVIAAAVQLAIEANGVVNFRTFLANLAVTWIIAIATYYGLLKPTGVTGKAAAVAPNAGIGRAA